jgi:hypothetical protein
MIETMADVELAAALNTSDAATGDTSTRRNKP